MRVLAARDRHDGPTALGGANCPTGRIEPTRRSTAIGLLARGGSMARGPPILVYRHGF
jgi:hypothetical protein